MELAPVSFLGEMGKALLYGFGVHQSQFLAKAIDGVQHLWAYPFHT